MAKRENYIAPASNTKGVQEVPGWRDPERAAQNWRDCARYLRRYALALLVALLALLWATGYAKGRLDGWGEGFAAARNETETKESNDAI